MTTTTPPSSSSPSATKAAAAAASATDFFTQTAKQSSDQVLRAIRQTAGFSLEATSAWLDTVAKIVPSVPSAPFLPSEDTVKVWTDAGFDAAQNLLDLQREMTGEVIAKMAALGA